MHEGTKPGGKLDTVFFFTRRGRHTRFDCDWSSDVCSSDLTLARMGLQGPRNTRIRAITNQRLLLDALQTQLLPQSYKALQTQDKDSSYPEWNDRYLRAVVAAQSAALADNAQRTLLETLPPEWVAEALIDLQPQDATMHLLPDLLAQDPTRRARLQSLVNEVMGNFGAHSRNAVRAIVKSGNRY